MILHVCPSVYHPSRDDTQIVGGNPNCSRDNCLRFRKTDFGLEIFGVGPILPAPPQSSREESPLGVRWDRTQHSHGSVHVAAGGRHHHSQWPDPLVVSGSQIFCPVCQTLTSNSERRLKKLRHQWSAETLVKFSRIRFETFSRRFSLFVTSLGNNPCFMLSMSVLTNTQISESSLASLCT